MMSLRFWSGLILLVCLVSSSHAAPPTSLTNFHDEHACDPAATLIIRPHTVEDVGEAVRLHDRVKATGEGHSWNQPFFCAAASASGDAAAANGSEPRSLPGFGVQPASRGLLQVPDAANDTAIRPRAVNIVMTTLRPLNISVKESEPSVWVDGGVKTADLLSYLANYVTPDAPAGYTLGAFPWFVYQTVAGAVATGTHGSNLGPHKSMSNQVLALEVVLANGTRRIFTNETDPFLMRALRVSVGRLGIITRVKLHLVKEVPVRRTLKALSTLEFLHLFEATQQAWTSNGTLPAWMNETQIFWLPHQQQFMMVGFTRSDSPDAANMSLAGYFPDTSTVFTKKGDVLKLGELVLPADAQVSINQSQVLVDPPASGPAKDNALYQVAQGWLNGYLNDVINKPVVVNGTQANDTDAASRIEGVSWTVPAAKQPSVFYGSDANAETLLNVSRLGINTVAGNLTAEAASIYIKQPAATLFNLQNTLYDQYEVSIPLAVMGTCWRKLLEVVHDGDLKGTNATQRARDKGFRTAPLVRFIGAEDGLLSHTHDGPRVYINIEDYKFYNTRRTINKPFKAVMAVLTGDPACTSKGMPRLHWGKAGWPDKGCWHGDMMYGNNWCSFGCAVKQLDPSDKFTGAAPDRWTWAGVDLDKCCGPDGFQAGSPGCECKVQHARAMSECPPTPYYTTR